MHRAPRLFHYPAREWRILAVCILLTVAAALATALQPWPMKLLVDQGLRGAAAPALELELLGWSGWKTSPRVLVCLAALASLVVFVILKAVEVGLTWAWTVASQRMVYRLAADLFDRFQRLSLMFHMRQRVGDLLARLTGDTWAVATVSEAALLAPLRQLLTLASVGWLAWQLDARLTALSFTVAPVLGVAGWWCGRSMRSTAQQHRDARSRLQNFVHQVLGAIPLVQVFGMEPRNRGEFDQLAGEVSIHAQRESVAKNMLTGLSGVALAVGTGAVLYVGSERVLSGN